MLKKRGSNSYKTLYIAFNTEQERNAVHDAITNYLPLECKNEETPIVEYTREWVKGGLTNFDYLQILNTYS